MIKNLPTIKENSNIFVLTGAGISQESGIKTFRDQDGLWENHNIKDIATNEGFIKNPKLVYNFYNSRRKELNNGVIKPNKAHIVLSELEKYLKINIITQNIDNLHELAGSSSVIYMHGELNKVRCLFKSHIHYWTRDLTIDDKCPECNSQMRPHICWFGEIPFQMDKIYQIASESVLFVSIGTSGEVYPAAGFVSMFKEMKKPTIELNLKPSLNQNQFDFSIHKPATQALNDFKDIILKKIKNI